MFKRIINFFSTEKTYSKLNYIAQYKKGTNKEVAEKLKNSIQIQNWNEDNEDPIDSLPLNLVSKETKLKIRELIIKDLKQRDTELEKWSPTRSVETNP